MSTPAITTEHLTHQYNPTPGQSRRGGSSPRRALEDLCFQVNHGEIFGVLGPNGGGKTTLFRVLATLLRPTHGTAKVCGHDVVQESKKVRRRIAAVFQNPGLDPQLTGEENLICHGRLYGLKQPLLQQRMDELLTQFALADRRHDLVSTYSGGMRRRIELVKAMLHQPPLLLLDEAGTGLDPGGRLDLWHQLKQLRIQRQISVLLTTHLMDEAERCDRLMILNAGRIVAIGAPEKLKASIGGVVFTIEPDPIVADNDLDRLAERIQQEFEPWQEGTAPVVIDRTVRFVKPQRDNLPSALYKALEGRIHSLTMAKPTLEDVFLRLTGTRMPPTNSMPSSHDEAIEC